MNMGRPLSSGAYSTTEPDGKPAAAPSEATVDNVPILQMTCNESEYPLPCDANVFTAAVVGHMQANMYTAAQHVDAAVTWPLLGLFLLPQRFPSEQLRTDAGQKPQNPALRSCLHAYGLAVLVSCPLQDCLS